ncbi:MAG: adenylate kinase [Cyanobacteria bacterium SIG31]|nr:adenylate kinase [Cyanobacteria bacterium SIG31]
MKKELIFLGPPACGKGTQTNMLSDYLNFPHIDTGSLLRAEIAKETEEGKIAKSFIDKGQLVPVDLVGTIIGKKLASADCKNGYVLDGYPRSIEQAKMLDDINAKVDGEDKVSFKAIYFDIDTEVLIDRIVNRKSCPVCGEIYNKKYKPAKVSGKCDKCNVDLVTRADDTEEIAKKRFETYYEQTAPLVEFYENKGVLYKIDANGTIDEVWKRLLEVVNA